MGEIVKFGCIGPGAHFERSHKPYINPRLGKLAAIADLNERYAREVASRYAEDEPAIYTDYHELLENPGVKAVMITTGDAAHFDMASDAVRAGKHVLVEKPAAVTVEELARLPALFDQAKEQGLKLWVCHPREFDGGIWTETAKLLGESDDTRQVIIDGERVSLGRLLSLDYGCLYTKPDREGLHDSFAADKLNHNVVSALQTLPDVTGFREAQLIDDSSNSYEARFVTTSDSETSNGIVIRSRGRRSADKENHGGGVWRDWVEAEFEEGIIRVEPSLGRIALTYGLKEQVLQTFDTSQLYDNMFGRFNTAFLECVRDPDLPEPITRRTMVIGTGAAILMQQGEFFDGRISEKAIWRLAA